MKNVVSPWLLAAAAITIVAPLAPAQTSDAATSGSAAGGQAQVQLSQDEYNAYQAGVTATTPAAKATAFEAYLKQYPNSTLKTEALNQILFADSQIGDQAKTLDAADRLLVVDPNNLRALTFEVFYRRSDADKLTDPAAKQTALDTVAGFAQRGLNAMAPKGVSDADFQKLKARTTQVFDSAIADDDLAKKDNAGAISTLKSELGAVDPAQTQSVGPVLQDEFTLANAYYTSTPPDYLNCAWYATRTSDFAPAAQKTTIQAVATYCYNKYHGSNEGYDKFTALTQTNLDPPSDLATTVTAAPKPEDIVKNLIATTPDLATLALSDKEFVLQYGQPADADKVFDTVKGKSVEIPGALVIASTPTQLQVAVSPDSVQGKVADFTFNMTTPPATPPAVGATITLSGTYTSYTQTPLMITMDNGAVVEPKKAEPTRRTPARRTR